MAAKGDSPLTLGLGVAALVGGVLSWRWLARQGHRLPAGSPPATLVNKGPAVAIPGAVGAAPLPPTLTTALVHWIPVSVQEPTLQGQRYAFYDALPPGLTTKRDVEQALSAFGWADVHVDAVGGTFPAWLPIRKGTDTTKMFAARASWGLMSPLRNRPSMMVAYKPGTPITIKQSQTATSLVQDSQATIGIYAVTDGTWWWASFEGHAAGGQLIHPQAVAYTSAEALMKLQGVVAHCVAPSASPFPPMVSVSTL